MRFNRLLFQVSMYKNQNDYQISNLSSLASFLTSYRIEIGD